jgi:hypothetical protein
MLWARSSRADRLEIRAGRRLALASDRRRLPLRLRHLTSRSISSSLVSVTASTDLAERASRPAGTDRGFQAARQRGAQAGILAGLQIIGSKVVDS